MGVHSPLQSSCKNNNPQSLQMSLQTLWLRISGGNCNLEDLGSVKSFFNWVPLTFINK